MFIVLLPGCTGSGDALPEQITGTWELHQVETARGEVDAIDAVLARYPGCVWGRLTFTFHEGHLESSVDVLCHASGQKKDKEWYGCSVAARVPAAWDALGGAWRVADAASARSRTVGLDESAMELPTVCAVDLAAGDYPVVRVRNQRWKWEMRTPDGTVYRFKPPSSERPDFVTALRERQEAIPTSPPSQVGENVNPGEPK